MHVAAASLVSWLRYSMPCTVQCRWGRAQPRPRTVPRAPTPLTSLSSRELHGASILPLRGSGWLSCTSRLLAGRGRAAAPRWWCGLRSADARLVPPERAPIRAVAARATTAAPHAALGELRGIKGRRYLHPLRVVVAAGRIVRHVEAHCAAPAGHRGLRVGIVSVDHKEGHVGPKRRRARLARPRRGRRCEACEAAALHAVALRAGCGASETVALCRSSALRRSHPRERVRLLCSRRRGCR